MDVELQRTSKGDQRLIDLTYVHYSQPGGFIGRTICYAIIYDNQYYGHICGGSATKHLPGRDDFLGISPYQLNNVVNNVFFHVEPVNGRYPIRNFTTRCVILFMKRIILDWMNKYGDIVIGFETLVEKPRTGDLYLKAGWTQVGETIGYTCKRVGGAPGNEKWSTSQRVWDHDKNNLRPKIVLCYKNPVQEISSVTKMTNLLLGLK